MKGHADLLYASKRSWRSPWHKYRIYSDRLELPSLVGTKVIPVSEILEVNVRPSVAIWDLLRGKKLAYCWGLKLDLADLCQHVALHRTSGIMKRLRFSPDNPEELVKKCRSAMKAKP